MTEATKTIEKRNYLLLSEEKHPALAELPWEWDADFPPGVHGIARKGSRRDVDYGPITYDYKCYCGHVTEAATGQEAFAALVAHAADFAGSPWWPYGTTVTDSNGNAWLSVAVAPAIGQGPALLGMHDHVVRPVALVVETLGTLTAKRTAR